MTLNFSLHQKQKASLEKMLPGNREMPQGKIMG
jgi:hypothetical protein